MAFDCKGGNGKRKQEGIKERSGVWVCWRGCPQNSQSCMGATEKSLSGGSVNIIQTFVCVCMCVIYSTELQVQQCFWWWRVRSFMQALRVRPTGGYTNQQSCAEQFRLWTYTTDTYLSIYAVILLDFVFLLGGSTGITLHGLNLHCINTVFSGPKSPSESSQICFVMKAKET